MDFSEETLKKVQILIENKFDFEETYDFTRCVTPQGKVYGTKGRCQPPNKPAKSQEPPKKFQSPKTTPTPILPSDNPMHVYSVMENTRANVKIKKELKALREAKRKDPKGWSEEKAIREAEKIGGFKGLLTDPKSREEVIERLKRFLGF